MKHFIFDLGRGVIIGLIVGYLIRPDAEIFTKIESAVDDGGKIVERNRSDTPPHIEMMPEFFNTGSKARSDQSFDLQIF